MSYKDACLPLEYLGVPKYHLAQIPYLQEPLKVLIIRLQIPETAPFQYLWVMEMGYYSQMVNQISG